MKLNHKRTRRALRRAALCILILFAVALILAANKTPGGEAAAPGMKTAKPVIVLWEPSASPPAAPEETEAPGRYAGIELSQDDLDMLAAIVYLEARGQSAEGQQAVVEVVLNRMLADNFPNTVQEVLYQPGQFTPARLIPSAEPTQAQYDAVDAALNGENILPEDVVYFSAKGENSRVWGAIDSHIFCYQYVWD